MTSHPDGIRVYRDEAGEYRWARYRSSRVIADSGEGYVNRGDCLEQAWREADAFQVPLHDETLEDDPEC